ncbi:hypothetical protein J5J10_06365 [Ciceribacter sp. L1K23]|uniref:FitA-like ribbon-helix-helix domain-containing protein n=1 Tax=Ciceribacter sp. L1K23 TaxID=2820276 RepID=UPI001B814695|nr:hypothetical protein [Ciceribacter sp. L1K23]MBR0555300.1 hypothetical protein [Ciceribacter sp. L1K23]
MAAVTIRNLSDDTHRALKQRAVAHGRSTEAEIRAILDAAVDVQPRLKAGEAFRAIVAEFGGVDLEIERDPSPPRDIDFE